MSAGEPDPPALPDRITVPTCIACGAMGRAARCAGACSEHRLPLVGAADLDALRFAGRAARSQIGLLEPIVRRLREDSPAEPTCPQVYGRLRDDARAALAGLERWDPERDWASADIALGWWCAECGNVDAPQPCLGICIWRPLDWVNARLYESEYERHAEQLRLARALARIVGRIAAIQPRPGRCVETWHALQAQAPGSPV